MTLRDATWTALEFFFDALKRVRDPLFEDRRIAEWPGGFDGHQ
jgi:hypothetical protein